MSNTPRATTEAVARDIASASECEICGGEGTVPCERCSGSGEGMADESTCQTCKGDGQVPCICQEDRLRDAKAAAESDAYEHYKDQRKYGMLK